MKMIVSQKRRITTDFVDNFSKFVGFTAEEKNYFSLLVAHGQAESDQEKEIFLNKIFEYRGRARHTVTIAETDEFLLNPLLAQLQVLLSFRDIQQTPAKLGQLLNIPEDQTRPLLKTLERLGLAQEFMENGSVWKPVEKSFTVPPNPGSAALTAYHNQAALEAIRAQDLPVDLRKFKSILLPLNEQDFKEFFVEIETTIKRVLAKYDKDEFQNCRLYKVNFNAYPVTEQHHESSSSQTWEQNLAFAPHFENATLRGIHPKRSFMRNLKYVLSTILLSFTLTACTSTQKPSRTTATETAGTWQVGSSNLTDQAVAVANVMLNHTVQNCLNDIRKSKKADLFITHISQNEDQLTYIINAELMKGGDMIMGHLDIQLNGRTEPEMGTFYECKIIPKN